jgi:hypothetical protein
MRNWRVGIEARISQLKRLFGLRRTRLRCLDGAKSWVGLGIFADNLQRMTVVSRCQSPPGPARRRLASKPTTRPSTILIRASSGQGATPIDLATGCWGPSEHSKPHP